MDDFLLTAEFIVLGVACARQTRQSTGRLLVAGVAVAALVAAYLSGTSLGLVYPRGYPAGLSPGGALLDTVAFFALDSSVLAWAFEPVSASQPP
jgi:lipopolysaccharide export LptBFGC system permease protein LptF